MDLAAKPGGNKQPASAKPSLLHHAPGSTFRPGMAKASPQPTAPAKPAKPEPTSANLSSAPPQDMPVPLKDPLGLEVYSSSPKSWGRGLITSLMWFLILAIVFGLAVLVAVYFLKS